ncbi:MAG TPA: tRNA epoxyqueuosine(34) reductase QueG [Vicinamibacterales bacterium]|nr:tRNA epoxyqueuosine(34) reductase QueG [Vicinamibacterales bacterium]
MDARAIKQKARELGFDRCGIAPAADLPELSFFDQWLARGYGGTMAYLQRSAERRADVRRVVPTARSVIVTATNYNTDRPYSTECADPRRAQIARYAWGDDYHDVVGARLDGLLAWMREASPEPFDARAYVDTGPVQERVYAQHAGVGWIGKNTCVINPELGSWIFLGVIICSLPLPLDAPATDQCGTCTLCLEACPTGAIVAPGVLDSNRCISYLTIELRGDVPRELEGGMGSHVYGCDVCQEVCPWNAVAPRSGDAAWQPRPAWDQVDLLTLADRSDDELAAALRRSPMRRTKAQGLRRNVAIALRNAEETDTRRR